MQAVWICMYQCVESRPLILVIIAYQHDADPFVIHAKHISLVCVLLAFHVAQLDVKAFL